MVTASRAEGHPGGRRAGGLGERQGRRLSVLLLADDDPAHADTIREHIRAFRVYSRHDVRVFNPRWLRTSRCLSLREFDVVVIHYSLCVIVDNYLSPQFQAKIRDFPGLKVQFIQDDYRWVDDISAAIRDMGIDVLFTLVPTREITKVWSPARLPGVVTINTLAGYVPDSLVGVDVPALESRSIDVGYRGRTLPFWLGRLGQEKILIARGVLDRAPAYGLRCDIAWSERDRLYGVAWQKFIMSCRAMLGTESGASITDFDGSIERQVRQYLDAYPDADFEEVYERVLWRYEGNVRMNVISPRMFEAIALRTPLVLFPGEYSGILEAERHYILLEKDFSNMGAVVEQLRALDRLEGMVARAHRDVVGSGRYSLRTFMRHFDSVLDEHDRPFPRRARVRYGLARLERVVTLPASGLFCHVRIRGTTGWRIGKRAMRALLAVTLALRFRETRALLVGWAKARPVRRNVSLRAVLGELLRLALVMQVCERRLGFEERASLDIRISPKGRLEFVSRRRSGSAVEPVTDRFCAAATANSAARVKEIVWNHAALGAHVIYPVWFRRGKGIAIPIGTDGVHEFVAVAAMADGCPAQLQALVASLLRKGPRIDVPSRLRRGVPPVSSVRSRREAVRKTMLGLSWILRRPSLRRILARFLASRRLRRSVPLKILVRDLARVALLCGDGWQFRRPTGDPVMVSVLIGGGGLTFRTVPGRSDSIPTIPPGAIVIPRAELSRIAWDHSAIGGAVWCRDRHGAMLEFELGPDGIYEFVALARVAREWPGDVEQALSLALPHSRTLGNTGETS